MWCMGIVRLREQNSGVSELDVALKQHTTTDFAPPPNSPVRFWQFCRFNSVIDMFLNISILPACTQVAGEVRIEVK